MKVGARRASRHNSRSSGISPSLDRRQSQPGNACHSQDASSTHQANPPVAEGAISVPVSTTSLYPRRRAGDFGTTQPGNGSHPAAHTWHNAVSAVNVAALLRRHEPRVRCAAPNPGAAPPAKPMAASAPPARPYPVRQRQTHAGQAQQSRRARLASSRHNDDRLRAAGGPAAAGAALGVRRQRLRCSCSKHTRQLFIGRYQLKTLSAKPPRQPSVSAWFIKQPAYPGPPCHLVMAALYQLTRARSTPQRDKCLQSLYCMLILCAVMRRPAPNLPTGGNEWHHLHAWSSPASAC